MITSEGFEKAMQYLMTAFPYSKIPTETMQVYWSVLRKEVYSDDYLMKVADRCVRTMTMFPKIAEILRIQEEIGNSDNKYKRLPEPKIVDKKVIEKGLKMFKNALSKIGNMPKDTQNIKVG